MRTPTPWLIGTLGLLLTGCATTPYTNRHQLMMVSEADEDQMGDQAYKDVLSKSKISKDAAANEMLQQVGQRLAKAADKPSYHWQFVLIDDPKMINAFCLPGGRVAVYTGILPVTQDANGLAVVLSHEVAHALARHGAERMSGAEIKTRIEQVAVQTGLIQSQGALQLAEVAYGVVGELPHSRAQESEADHIGLILMAKAGYDPRQAIDFWKRMSQAKGGNAPPVFLSSHPSDSQRIERIQGQIPEAMTYYKP